MPLSKKIFRRLRRPIIGLLAGLSLATMLAATAAGAPDALPAPFRAPYTPEQDSELLQQVPAVSDPKVVEMRSLRAKLDAAPGSLETADLLSRAYIDFGRQLGDAHYAGYAEAVIAPWFKKPQPPVAALLVQATILQYRHQFADARALLKQALQRDANNAQGWLSLAILDMVQGDYTTANADCVQAARSGGPTLAIACTGNLRSYVGQAQASLLLLRQIEGDAPQLPVPFKAWIEGLLAETCERLGDWPQAEAHYRKALAYTPQDNFLLVAYADFLLDRGRPQEVLPLLADHTQSDTAFLRIALAKAALKSPDLARYVWIMAARFEALRQRGSDFYGREQVRFALYLQHDPQTALELAQANWQAQRAPWDARVFLEAASAADQPKAAAPVLAFLKQTRLQDPLIEPLAKTMQAQLDGAPGAAK